MFKSIRSRLFFLSVSGSILAIVIGVVAFTTVDGLSSDSEASQRDITAVRQEMLADQCHDALRADVMSALNAAKTSAAERPEIEKETSEHVAAFRDALKSIESLDLAEDTKQAIAKVIPDVDAYLSSAPQVVSMAFEKPDTIGPAFDDFKSKFSKLEGSLGDLGDKLEATANANQKAQGDAFAHAHSLLLTLLIAGAGAAVGLALFGSWIARGIATPLRYAVETLKSMAAGDFTARLEHHSNDELGEMSKSLNSALDNVERALTDVRAASEELAGFANSISTSTSDISDGSQKQASALEETAASLEEITGTVKQNADSAKQANQLALNSRSVAERGGKIVADAVESIREINRSSEKIAAIIGAIDEIAFQTNLLALNAAVEAARAGEQGRGFAVVASEVRNLAQRSAVSAKEIKTLIEESLQKVAAGSELVDRSGKALEEIVGSVKRVTDIIGEIAAASQEQSVGVEQVNRAVTQMDQSVQSNAGQTAELAGTSRNLAAQAQRLQDLVAQFRVQHSEHTAPRAAGAPAPQAPLAAPRRAPAPSPARTSRSARSSAVPSSVSAASDDQGFIDF